MEELKPCPFCGDKPNTDKDSAWCCNGLCVMYAKIIMLDAWNTRATESALQERVKELEEEVKAYRDFDKFQEPEWVKENESLRKRVKELEAELKERQEAFDRASCCVVEERLVNERLERKLKIAEEALTAIDNNCACGGYMEVIYGGKGRRCNKCGKESK